VDDDALGGINLLSPQPHPDYVAGFRFGLQALGKDKAARRVGVGQAYGAGAGVLDLRIAGSGSTACRSHPD